MKGLWKYIAPFAPDQSGAAAVLYGLGGIVVVCDAGGCAGNICGFDEPRWFSGARSAVFSAGLRDMDAVLGRDDRLVAKLCDAVSRIDASFAAIIGTPVPAVIGTDYKALRRLAEHKLHIPVITIATNGIHRYDWGASLAYEELLRRLAKKDVTVQAGRIGVLGAIPLDTNCADEKALSQALQDKGYKDVVFLGQNGISDYYEAGRAEKNIVLSPAGIKGAQYLEEMFGTPYEYAFPLLPKTVTDLGSLPGKRVLVVHQQVLAGEIRKVLSKASVTVATWFMAYESLMEPGDVVLKEEDDFIDLAMDHYDVIIGDGFLKRAIPAFSGLFVDVPHFALSGRLWNHE